MNGCPPGKVIPLFPRAPSDAPPPRSVSAKRDGDLSQGEETSDDREGPEIEDLYSAAQVSRLLGISVSRLRYWARTGLVSPSRQRGRRRAYSFQDLVSVRATLELLGGGLSTRKLRRAVDKLREQLPHHSSPLSGVRVASDGKTVVVRHEDKPFEAETGQLLLDFSVGELHEHVVQLVQPGQQLGVRDRKSAFDWYLAGCSYEATPESLEKAESAYRRAIELDPQLACAYTNLGNLRYRAGSAEDAQVLYQKALDLEPDQPEAHYNLGYLSYEEGESLEAVPMFERAIELDQDFGDAHFNLAMALEEVGKRASAKTHFAAYLSLEPDGPWADIARRHLA